MRKILILYLIVFLSNFVYSEEKVMNKIKFSFDNKEIIVILNNNSASNSLLEQLPLKLKFENYGEIEKISYIPEKLDISNSPKSCTPKIYDLTYYSPWGNLAFFLKDFRHSNGLVPIGEIESGFNNLKFINNSSVVIVEKIVGE